MEEKSFLITGADGQLGRALKGHYKEAQSVDKSHLDITDPAALDNFNWQNVRVLLNAAAYTNVDGAEAAEGRELAQKVNSEAIANLAHTATKHDILLVHISTDYVFDGTNTPHTEDEPFNPLNAYGQTKAEGDKAVIQVPKHYLIRTSWVIGDGKNFVRTMLGLGQKGISPTVVADQIGRPTFTTELVRAIDHLLKNNAPYGTYNISNSGEPVSWADFARAIFKQAGFDLEVRDTTTAEYFKNKPNIAKRPLNSVFDLSKMESIGFKFRDWHEDLAEYIRKELQ